MALNPFVNVPPKMAASSDCVSSGRSSGSPPTQPAKTAPASANHDPHGDFSRCFVGKGWFASIAEVLRAEIAVNVRWSMLPGYDYSIDVQTRAGDWITSCVDSAHIGKSTQFEYRGVCVGASDFLLDHANIAAFRVNYILRGQLVDTATQRYDGYSSDVYAALTTPGSATTALSIRWNYLGDNALYALDVQMPGTDWIRCADDKALANEPAYIHTGICWSAGVAAPIRDITKLRVCAIDRQSGQPLGCSHPRPFNGRTPHTVVLQIKPPG